MSSILLDKNMPFSLIELFKKFNFRVYHIKRLGKTGIRNGEVYTLSLTLTAWILTRNTDFENLAKFYKHEQQGTTSAFLFNLFKNLLNEKSIDFSQRQLIVIDDNGITIKIDNNA